MITDSDIKKMKKVFATKVELKAEAGVLDKKIDGSIQEVLNFIVETKNDIMKELNDFRQEMRDINRNYQSTLNNHEARITHLEFNK